MRHGWTAISLLIVGLLCTYLWQIIGGDQLRIGQIWNISGAIYRMFLLSIIAIAYRSREITIVAILLFAFDLLVVGCTGIYMFSPWPSGPEEEFCSTRLGIPLGVCGALLGLAILLNIVRRR